MLNTYHPTDTQNSYAHGLAISEPVELALAAFERVCPKAKAGDLCGIAEAIIEAAGGDGVAPDWREIYRGVEDGSARYKAARRAFEAVCKARAA